MMFRRIVRAWPRLSRDLAPVACMAEARSHAGHVRTVNEDCYLSRSDRGLWAVADGMGGHSDGITAASIVISALEDAAENGSTLDDESVRKALEHSNRLICAMEKPGRVSGATIVAAWRDGEELVVYWAGDSRAYHVSGGKARMLTSDHSVVQELVDAGAISAAEAKSHPQSHVITRALGVRSEVEVESVRVRFRPGDLVLLCSDGLSRTLTIGDLTVSCPSLGYFADKLMANALRRDGNDNATLVLIERRT